jgi:general secretion pathway protein C
MSSSNELGSGAAAAAKNWPLTETEIASPANKLPLPLAAEPLASQAAANTLMLRGTVRGRNAYEGTASIGMAGGKPLTYAAGAILPNGTRIAEIYDDRIVLTRDAESAELFLSDAEPYRASALEANPLLVFSRTETPAQAVPQVNTITDYLRPTPVYDGDTLTGFQVFPGKRDVIFAQLGLEPADLILALDGQPLSSPDDAIDRLSALASGIAVVASIERAGRTTAVSLDGALIYSDTFNKEHR